MDTQRHDALTELIRDGATLTDFIKAHNDVHPPTEKQLRCIDKAYEDAQEGVVEVDEPTMASGSTDGGDYVLAWMWVDDPEPNADDDEEPEPED